MLPRHGLVERKHALLLPLAARSIERQFVIECYERKGKHYHPSWAGGKQKRGGNGISTKRRERKETPTRKPNQSLRSIEVYASRRRTLPTTACLYCGLEFAVPAMIDLSHRGGLSVEGFLVTDLGRCRVRWYIVIMVEACTLDLRPCCSSTSSP